MNYFDAAVSLCTGRGLEIGALSNPAPLNAKVVYADICDKATSTSILCALEGGPFYDLQKLVEPNVILQAPHFFLPFANGELDFVFSSHALEHTPNFVAAIYDQLRCVKLGGVVYFVVPNRRGTYDHRRPATAPEYLIRRFETRSFTFSRDDASELLWGTAGHPHYEQKTQHKLEEIHTGGSGAHHFVVFTPASLLELLRYVCEKFNCEVVYFHASDPIHIHVCLKKLGDSRI